MVTQIITWSHRLLHGHTEITEITEIVDRWSMACAQMDGTLSEANISVISVISV